MTDPVDTDALRENALDLEAVRADARLSNTQWARVHIVKRALFTVADEVDRLRTDVAEWKAYAEAQKRHWQAENVNRKAAEDDSARLRDELDAWEPTWRKMRDERDRARAAIENAPHAEYCQMSYLSTYPKARCTCWKAETQA